MNRKILVMILADLSRNGEDSVFFERFESAVNQCIADNVGKLRSSKLVDKYSFLINANAMFVNRYNPWSSHRFVEEIGGDDALKFLNVDLSSTFDEHDLIGLSICFRSLITPTMFFELCELDYDCDKIRSAELLLNRMWLDGNVSRCNMVNQSFGFRVAC